MNQHAPNPHGYASAPPPGAPQHGAPPQQQQYGAPPQQQQYGAPPQQYGAPPQQQQQYAAQPGYAAGPPQQPPQEDLSNYRARVPKAAPGKSNIDFGVWKDLPEQQTFNLPGEPDKVRMLPLGTWRAQVLWAGFDRKKPEWGGGVRLNLKLGFHAVVQGNSYPYIVWKKISLSNAESFNEFATAVIPGFRTGEDDLGANDIIGLYVMISVGFGSGNWAQGKENARIVIQKWSRDTQAGNGAAPAPQQHHQQQAPQHHQQAPQQHHQAPAPQQQHHQAPPPGYGQTYGGPTPAPAPTAGGYGAPPQGYAPNPGDLPF
jgi:hypothetical protein